MSDKTLYEQYRDKLNEIFDELAEKTSESMHGEIHPEYNIFIGVGSHDYQVFMDKCIRLCKDRNITMVVSDRFADRFAIKWYPNPGWPVKTND